MNASSIAAAVSPAETRISRYDWETLSRDLNRYGCAVVEKLLSPDECRQLVGLYPAQEHVWQNNFLES